MYRTIASVSERSHRSFAVPYAKVCVIDADYVLKQVNYVDFNHAIND